VAARRKYSDRRLSYAGTISCVFQVVPCAFEKNAVLRVHNFRFGGSDAEEACVKARNVRENSIGMNVIRIGDQLGFYTRGD